MIIKRLYDRITKGRLLTPQELEIYNENLRLSAYVYREFYLANILEQYPISQNLEEPLLGQVKSELYKLIYEDPSIIGSNDMELALQNIISGLSDKSDKEKQKRALYEEKEDNQKRGLFNIALHTDNSQDLS